MADPLIIIGASARAAAQSAIRAGYAPWCIDLFADIDLHAIAPVKRCPREKWPHGVLELMEDAPAGQVLLTGAMENHIDVARALAERIPGGKHHVKAMEALRDPRLDRFSDSAAVKSCVSPRRPPRWTPAARGRWLVKRRRGAGGIGIRVWQGETLRASQGEYLQKFIEGTPISVIIHSDGKSEKVFGVTEQLVGEPCFGAGPFQYCGSIFPRSLSDLQFSQFESHSFSSRLPSAFRGPLGVDAIVDPGGSIWPVEINPRYTASIEVIERGTGRAVLKGVALDHRRVLESSLQRGRCFGKAVVFARSTCAPHALAAGFDSDAIADIPQNGEHIDAGHPVCTVFADGPTRDACYAGLREMAEKVYTRLQPA